MLSHGYIFLFVLVTALKLSWTNLLALVKTAFTRLALEFAVFGFSLHGGSNPTANEFTESGA